MTSGYTSLIAILQLLSRKFKAQILSTPAYSMPHKLASTSTTIAAETLNIINLHAIKFFHDI